MNTPKEIYLQVCGDCHGGDCRSCKFDSAEVSWCEDKIFEKDVKYIRSDLMLRLTVEDIERIHTLLDAVRLNKTGAFTFTRLKTEQYADVLKRFNNVKRKK